MLRLVRNILSDRNDDYTFYRYNPSQPVTAGENTGLYIHIPFCTHFCPYCPYLKIRYEPATAREYARALVKEIGLYRERLGSRAFTSVYFGGGTPTLLADELGEILEHLHRHFTIHGSIAIETTPTEAGKETLKKLRGIGFNLVSLGVQSFNDRYLAMIGRDYDSQTALRALGALMEAGFDTVNLDLIFAIGDQAVADLRSDLTIAATHQVHQVTCYPLFTFPYSEIGRAIRINRVKMPGILTRKKMYYFIHHFLEEHGYKRTNVWSFCRDTAEPFSSVTRDHYLGLGAGAGSYNGGLFYFNTFSVPEYIQTVNSRLPIAVSMEVSRNMEGLFRFYWQLYRAEMTGEEYRRWSADEAGSRIRFLPGLMRRLGFTEPYNGGGLRLNTRGSCWIHLLQNHFALDYVNKIWSASKKDPWPGRITL